MTNSDIAQKWVQGLSIIQHHIEIANDKDLWQKDPQRVLKAVNSVNDLKLWCLNVMKTMPEMEHYFLNDIEERGNQIQQFTRHNFFFLEENTQSNGDTGYEV